ncbi:carbohydrate ABC transporter substrate-binding protein (CUT1 family) [Paractinoplanes brasiliensis]|uniref:Carbohydrate ABC transporter substrate-binding protein (CUT1 family) n=1 Tax=Paractinoplanes brasiliensis TaxID=52695 RepID=A0A4R6JAG9_9ACTN|nr:carbohydrate ABC transporter substrate-binding protein (CUT1 family) [Actinoplanes brasiliensis]GID27632.1 sugar ABC transporter substrate-binding protein [Actinoplanes brasiliensis]
MNAKRWTALTAVTALALGVAACGGDDEGGAGGAGKTLNVLIAANTQYPDEFQAWQKDISEKFKAATGAEVKFETFATANDELTKIQTSVVSGSGPDVYAVGTTFTPTAYSTGAFVKMGDEQWQKIGGKDKFNPATLGISGPDDQNQVGIPWVSRPFVMAYNTELLQAAGIDQPATTWDELTAQAKQLTKGDQYGLAIAYKDNFDPWKFVWGMSTQAGNPLIDGKTAKLQDPAVQKAYQTYFGWLANDKVVDPASVGWTNPQALAAFAKGKTGYFLLTTTTATNSLDSGAVKGKWKFALLPTVPPGATSRPAGGVEAASILSGDNLLVADYSKNKDLAFEYVKLVTDQEAQLDYYQKFGNLPANAAALQTLASDQKLEPVTEAAKKSVATPFTGAWADVQLALTNVAVQTLPELTKGPLNTGQLDSRIADAQKAAQSSLDRAK